VPTVAMRENLITVVNNCETDDGKQTDKRQWLTREGSKSQHVCLHVYFESHEPRSVIMCFKPSFQCSKLENYATCTPAQLSILAVRE
jgi:hypothetical protein